MDEQKEKDLIFHAEWNRELLLHMNNNPTDDGPALMRRCAGFHYNLNNMDQLIEPFIGNLEAFIVFLTKEWGWIVNYDDQEHVIIADENKEYCVCPIVRSMEGKKISTLLCHCSEGFGKIMFSKVIGREVSTEVLKSILRGDKSCIYRIWF